MALTTSRRSVFRGRPFFDGEGNKGAITDHSSSVRSVGYRLSFFMILAMRPRDSAVHMASLDNDHTPRSSPFSKSLLRLHHAKSPEGVAGRHPDPQGDAHLGYADRLLVRCP